MSYACHPLWHFHSKLHKFNDVSWKSGEEISKFGIVICNGRISDDKLGFYLMETHSRVRLLQCHYVDRCCFRLYFCAGEDWENRSRWFVMRGLYFSTSFSKRIVFWSENFLKSGCTAPKCCGCCSVFLGECRGHH